ncbi:hypothetical protein LCGC14_2169740, partial [marine sediment metagenome]
EMLCRDLYRQAIDRARCFVAMVIGPTAHANNCADRRTFDGV